MFARFCAHCVPKGLVVVPGSTYGDVLDGKYLYVITSNRVHMVKISLGSGGGFTGIIKYSIICLDVNSISIFSGNILRFIHLKKYSTSIESPELYRFEFQGSEVYHHKVVALPSQLYFI